MWFLTLKIQIYLLKRYINGNIFSHNEDPLFLAPAMVKIDLKSFSHILTLKETEKRLRVVAQNIAIQKTFQYNIWIFNVKRNN